MEGKYRTSDDDGWMNDYKKNHQDPGVLKSIKFHNEVGFCIPLFPLKLSPFMNYSSFLCSDYAKDVKLPLLLNSTAKCFIEYSVHIEEKIGYEMTKTIRKSIDVLDLCPQMDFADKSMFSKNLHTSKFLVKNEIANLSNVSKYFFSTKVCHRPKNVKKAQDFFDVFKQDLLETHKDLLGVITKVKDLYRSTLWDTVETLVQAATNSSKDDGLGQEICGLLSCVVMTADQLQYAIFFFNKLKEKIVLANDHV